ncbi:MAG: type 4a pilus biogenesis protein PilO [Deltaproteobacteria bacterium]|nr:type 4a pilus biogenesis protein PilO [Deltaproteobacteria bacterium]MBI2540595.1 type 4a pilus biogenesis protein PilO [Deltaproteobacteria bacterium]MBI2991559.1 type 4a pilus biogenesis protein PilO [Deltaproteobacteria bacterium]
MQELLDRILGLPQQQKLAALGVLILLILGLDYFFLYSPRSDEISKLAQEIENGRVERDKKKKEVANIPKLKQQMVQLDGRLKEAVAQLPDRKEIPDLLSTISSKVKEAGLDILVFRPRGENLQEFYAEIPVDIVVRGGFHNVVTFFDEVGRMSRLVNISNIELRNPKASGDVMVMEGSSLATTFRFLDEAERARMAAQKAAAAKKK